MKTAHLGSALIISCAVPALAAHSYPEKYYQNKWCAEHHGQAEVVLEDQTRADCITLRKPEALKTLQLAGWLIL